MRRLPSCLGGIRLHFRFHSQPPSNATGGRTGEGRSGSCREGGEAQNFRHQKELLSIITGLAPKELHFADCGAASFLLSSFLLLDFILFVRFKVLPTFMRIQNALFFIFLTIFMHFLRAFYAFIVCGFQMRDEVSESIKTKISE